MDVQRALTPIDAVIITEDDQAALLDAVGLAANQAATSGLLADYQARKSLETLRRQVADVALFTRYLLDAGKIIPALAYDLAQWRGVSWGLIDGFNRWQLAEGYAIGSINVRLATVKTYCELACKAGHISSQDLALIKTVKGYRQAEGRNVNEKRAITRRDNAKKETPVSILPVHASLLKAALDETRRGRRDSLLMCLLLDHGLRIGEIAALNVSSIDLQAGALTFYRHKVDAWQEHALTPDTYQAARTYLADCAPDQGPLFLGTCSKTRVNTRSLDHRVLALGVAIGLAGLSPHDCRHYWATQAIRCGTDIKSLQDAGGWSSPAMPLRYAESSKVANAGVKLTS